ncbi:MAG: hypothetical protein AAGA85_16995 [Bacteroidota bacterium]
MKNLFKVILMGLVCFTFSCEDEDAAPIFYYEDLEIGAYARLVENSGNFLVDLNDLDAFTHSYVVEFVDEQNGSLTDAFSIDVVYDPADGDDQTVTEFRSYTSADFTMNDGGFMQSPSISFTSADLLGAFGLSNDDLAAEDRFRVAGRLTHSNGRVFNAVNSSATVESSFFQGYFDFQLFVGCSSDVTGMYAVSSTSITCDGAPATVTGTAEISSAGDVIGIGEYEFDDWTFGTAEECFDSGGPAGFQFIDRCGVVTFDLTTDEFGTTWSYSSVIDGDDWVITWQNPDNGLGAVTTVTFPGGVPFTVE